MIKICHDIILDCLKELSDKSYQDRVWAKDARPEMSSFEETFSQLYGGTGLGFSYDKGQPVYGDEIDGLLKNLRTTLRGIPTNRPPAELVQDEKMVPVRKTAAHILSLIEQQDKEERSA